MNRSKSSNGQSDSRQGSEECQNAVPLRRFQQHLALRLLSWGLASMLGGGLLRFGKDVFWRGFGIQSVGWGLVDAAVALISLRSSRREAESGTIGRPASLLEEARGLRRLMLINTGLDVLYVAGGLRLARHAERRWRGHGWGILTQGLFLLLFDLIHALQLRSVPIVTGTSPE